MTAQSQNVDANEIAKFERLASQWWDKTGDFKPLHDINPLRANYIDRHAKVAGKKVLDVGCGGGILCEALAQRGADVTGIDMGEAPLEVAKLHLHESQLDINYTRSTAEDYRDQHAGQFDIVTCLEMLEHVPDPAATIKACADLVKPGGQLFFSTINRNPKSYLFAIIGAEYILGMLPKGTHDYKKFIQPAELCQWARDAGLSINDTTGMTYNPIMKTYRLNARDLDVNYLVFTTKPE